MSGTQQKTKPSEEVEHQQQIDTLKAEIASLKQENQSLHQAYMEERRTRLHLDEYVDTLRVTIGRQHNGSAPEVSFLG